MGREFNLSQSFYPGKEAWYASDSRTSHYSAVFEDDGETAYFYAYDRGNEGRVLDTIHIYNVSSVVDRDRESVAEIIWTTDGLKAVLLINGSPHGAIDFAERCSYSCSEFPSGPSDGRRAA